MTHTSSNQQNFYTLGLAPSLIEAIEKLNFKVPTPIQAKAIPVAITGQDVIGIAQTGTGKTLAFGLPLIQSIARNKGMGLIILPTRELALQVEETLHKVGKPLGLRTAIIIGGASMHAQIQMLRKNPHVVIGTPGRMNDHLQQRTLNLSTVNVVVLDEADRMLDMGFAPQIKTILEKVPTQRQTMLFSATMPEEIVRMAGRYMKTPTRVEIARAGTLAEQIEQELFFVGKDQKKQLIEALLTEYKGTVLVFSRTKFGAKKIRKMITAMGHAAAEIHSDRSLGQRKDALFGFKSGKYRVLVATDIAARGIDVTGIELVVNYDLPDNPEDYVHRIGRTGRAGMTGTAVSFATPDQRRDVKDIERLIRANIPVSPLPTLPPQRNFERHESVEFFNGGQVFTGGGQRSRQHQGGGGQTDQRPSGGPKHHGASRNRYGGHRSPGSGRPGESGTGGKPGQKRRFRGFDNRKRYS